MTNNEQGQTNRYEYDLLLPNGEHVTNDDDCCLTIVYRVNTDHAINPDQVSRFRVRRSQSMKYYIEVVNPNIKFFSEEDTKNQPLKDSFLTTVSSWAMFYDSLFELLSICSGAEYITGNEEADGPYGSLRATLPSYLYIQDHYAGDWMADFGVIAYRQ